MKSKKRGIHVIVNSFFIVMICLVSCVSKDSTKKDSYDKIVKRTVSVNTFATMANKNIIKDFYQKN